ncbi:MAG: TIM barrel protein [Candidatus Bathyarchaeia archaeon]
MLAAYSQAGVSVPVMLMSRWASTELLQGAPGAEQERSQLFRSLAALGEAEVGSLLFYVRLERAVDREPEQWRNLVGFYREFGREAERCGVRVATHAFYRSYSVVRNTETLTRLIKESSSRSVGVTYCQGLYLLGDDVYDAIRRFQSRIFFAHARDLRKSGDTFEEVPLGKGDIDFARVLRLLQDAGYEGLICPEHLGQEQPGVDLEAEAVRYLKKLLLGLGA